MNRKNHAPKTQEMSLNVGISSLMIVFIILCLSTFPVLALSSAASDRQNAEQAAQRRTSYYEALSKAEQICHDIDILIEENLSMADLSTTDLADALSAYEYEGITPELILSEGSSDADGASTADVAPDALPCIRFAVPETDQRVLAVTLQLTDMDDPYHYDIVQWQIVDEGAWEGSESGNFMTFEY